MHIKINYELTGIGWAKADFIMPHTNISWNFSYLSDPLPDLLKAVIEIYESKKHFAEVVFTDEPGEHRLQITRISKKDVQLSFYSHDAGFLIQEITGKKKSKNNFEVIFLKIEDFAHQTSYQCSLKELVVALAKAVDDLVSIVPILKYKSEWSMSFPAKLYSKIKELS